MATLEGVKEVDRLLRQLQDNLENATLSPSENLRRLERVKVLGRSAETASPIFTRQAISTVSSYAFDHGADDVSREALRILANAFLLHEPARQTFVELQYAPKAADRLRGDSVDDEFLISRILFLLTYNTHLDLQALVANTDLAGSINQCISKHAQRFDQEVPGKPSGSTMDVMAMTETLKLLFNLTYHYPDLVPTFTTSAPHLAEILLRYPLPTPPLQPPVTSLINALLNLHLGYPSDQGQEMAIDSKSPRTENDAERLIERLIDIFAKAVAKYSEQDLDQAAAPLCTLLRRVYEASSASHRHRMQELLLPTHGDRDKPLGQGETLAAKLLRLSCSPNLPNLRDNISSLLFELSDKDAAKLIKNIGYGFASGFLASNRIPIPTGVTDASSSSPDPSVVDEQSVNPITGQRLDAERRNAPEAREMSQDEKEREAERLFVLIERLKATGVIDIKNPVEQAIEEGRFEELD